MEASVEKRLLEVKSEDLTKLSKKEIISFYKDVYSSNSLRSSATKKQLVDDIMEFKRYIIRNNAINSTNN